MAALLAPALAVLACSSSSSGSGSRYACHYTSSVSTVCNGYNDYSEDPGCIQVSSQSECKDYTKSSTDCAGGCCTDTSYVDVSTVPGSCSSTSGTGGGGGSSGGGGTSGGGGSGGGGSACPPAAGDNACLGCIKSACCAELNACGAIQQCVDLASCVDNCASNDSNCINACGNSYPAGENAFVAYVNCASDKCSGSC